MAGPVKEFAAMATDPSIPMLFMLWETEPVALRTEARNDSNRESPIGLSQLSGSLPLGAMRNVVSFIVFVVGVSGTSASYSLE